MKQTKCENNTISHKKPEIKSIIDYFRKLLRFIGLNTIKKVKHFEKIT